MRQADPPIYYLVGTPKGRLTKLEKALLKLPWQAVREGVDVKLLPKDRELYVLAKSDARILKERGIRRRKLRWLLARLKEISKMELQRDDLLMKLGAALTFAPGVCWSSMTTALTSKDFIGAFLPSIKTMRSGRAFRCGRDFNSQAAEFRGTPVLVSGAPARETPGQVLGPFIDNGRDCAKVAIRPRCPRAVENSTLCRASLTASLSRPCPEARSRILCLRHRKDPFSRSRVSVAKVFAFFWIRLIQSEAVDAPSSRVSRQDQRPERP
jgi:hypothetical protein